MSILEKIKRTKTLNSEDFLLLCEELSMIGDVEFVLKVDSIREVDKYICIMSFSYSVIRHDSDKVADAIVFCVLKYVDFLEKNKRSTVLQDALTAPSYEEEASREKKSFFRKFFK